jgi:hypothetical protein
MTTILASSYPIAKLRKMARCSCKKADAGRI